MVVKILSVVEATIQSHKTGGWIDKACVWKNLTHEHINQIVQIAFLFYFFSPVFCVWASFGFVLKKNQQVGHLLFRFLSVFIQLSQVVLLLFMQ